MATGIMEVHIGKAKGLDRKNCFCGVMEFPYVLLQYEGQVHRSKISEDMVWNESFLLNLENNGSSNKQKLILKIMDADDFIAQAIIDVKDLVAQGVENGKAEIPPLKYRVVRECKLYRGEIEVGITFFLLKRYVEEKLIEEDIGGWRESIYSLP